MSDKRETSSPCHKRVLPKNVRVSGGDNGIAPEQQDALVCIHELFEMPSNYYVDFRLTRELESDGSCRFGLFVMSRDSDCSSKKNTRKVKLEIRRIFLEFSTINLYAIYLAFYG